MSAHERRIASLQVQLVQAKTPAQRQRLLDQIFVALRAQDAAVLERDLREDAVAADAARQRRGLREQHERSVAFRCCGIWASSSVSSAW